MNNLVRSSLGILGCLQFTTMFFLSGFCSFLFILLLLSSYWYIALLYLAWWLYDRDTPYRGGRRLPILRKLFIWKYLAGYFPVKLHKTVDLDPAKNYIFAVHPHGVMCYGGFVNFCTDATDFDYLFPGITMHVLSINLQFRSPFYRDYVIAGGVGSVDRESIDYKLTQMGPGHSVLIAIGGAAEIMLAHDHTTYMLKLKMRKGFIRRALKTGASVVPVFSFNEHRVYEIPIPKKGSLLDRMQNFQKSFSNDVMPLDIRGRWRWAATFVPKPFQIDTVVGAPINFAELKSVTKGQDPPEELVDECHEIYIEALRKLYDEHKARFGDENTPLIFV